MPKSKVRKKTSKPQQIEKGRIVNGKTIAAVAVAGVAIWVVLSRGSGGVDQATFDQLVVAGQPALADVVTVPELGRNHVRAGTPMEYRNDPPTSGTHWDVWVDPGFYGQQFAIPRIGLKRGCHFGKRFIVSIGKGERLHIWPKALG